MYGSAPPPTFKPYSQIVKGDTSNSLIISIHNNTGTHIDAPKHFIDNGKSISDYLMDELVFRNPVINYCKKESAELILPDDLKEASNILEQSDCLLLCTGYARFRNEEKYRTHNPGIAPETILWLRSKYHGIRCIGIDCISISSFQHREKGREAHKAAFIDRIGLGNPLLLIEDLNLEILESNEVVKKIIIIPWQIVGIDSSPCIVWAEVV